jgi:hypothetical protein
MQLAQVQGFINAGKGGEGAQNAAVPLLSVCCEQPSV